VPSEGSGAVRIIDCEEAKSMGTGRLSRSGSVAAVSDVAWYRPVGQSRLVSLQKVSRGRLLSGRPALPA